MSVTKKKTSNSHSLSHAIRRLLKWMAVSIASIATGIIVIFLLVVIFIKFGDVTPATQSLLSHFSKGEASIGSIDLSHSGLIEARNFHLEMPDGSLYEIKNISIQGDFASAIYGRLEIESVIIDGVTVSIISHDAGKGNGGDGSLPLIPLPTYIKSLVVKNISVRHKDERGSVSLSGLNILSTITASFDGVSARVFFDTASASSLSIATPDYTALIVPTAKLAAEFRKDGKWSLDGDLLLDLKNIKGRYMVKPGRATANIKAEGSYLNRLTGHGKVNLSLFENSTAQLEADWEEKDGGVSYAITSDSARIDLAMLLDIFDVTDIRIDGTAEVNAFAAEGFLPDTAGERAEQKLSLNGEVAFTHFAAPDVKADRGGVLGVNLTNLEIMGESMRGGLSARLDSPEIIIGSTMLENGLLSVSAEFAKAEDKKGIKKISRAPSERTVDLFFKAGKVTQGALVFENFMVGAKGVGDILEGDIREIEGNASISQKSSIRFHGALKKFGKKNIDLETKIKVADLAWLKALINKHLPIDPAGGSLAGQIKLTGAMGANWDHPSFDIDITSQLTSFSAKIEKDKLELKTSDIEFKAKGKIGENWGISDITADLDLKSGGVNFRDSLSLGALSATATISSRSPGKEITSYTVHLNTKSVTVGAKENGSSSVPASLDIEGSIDPRHGKQIVKLADLTLDDTSHLKAEGWLDEVSRKFQGSINADKLDLKLMESFMMVGSRSPFPITRWGGTITAELRGGGTIPDSISALKESIPFTLTSKVSLKDGKFKFEKEGLGAEGIDLDLIATVGESKITTSGGLWVNAIHSEKLFGAVALDPTFEFDLALEDMDRLIVERFVLDTPALGFVQMLDGSIEGLKLSTIFDDKNNYKKIIPGLTANLDSYFTFVLDERQKFLIDMDISGEVTAYASLTMSPGEGLRFQGDHEFKNFSITKGDIKYIENLNGSGSFIKTLSYKKEGEPQNNSIGVAAKKSKSVRETTFFDDLRETGSSKESFAIKLIELGPITFRDTLFDLNLDEARLGIDYLRTHLLGGGLTGSFYIKSEGDTFVLRTTGGFAGVDLERMIKSDLGLSDSEAKVDGSVSVELKLGKEDEGKGLDINSINFSAYLTRIGSKALDRLLKFFDPGESSPSIMNARTLLLYATPKRVELIARNGNLSLTIDQKYSILLGGLEVRMPVIKRAPIHGLVNFEVIKSELNKLSALKTVMRVIGATSLEVTHDGEIILR